MTHNPSKTISRTIIPRYPPVESSPPKQPHDMFKPRSHDKSSAAIKAESIRQIMYAEALNTAFDKSATAQTSSSAGRKYATAYAKYFGKI